MNRKNKRRTSDVTRTLTRRHLSVKTGESTFQIFSLLEVAEKLGRGETLVNGGGTKVDFEFILNLLGVFNRKQRSVQRLKYVMALMHKSTLLYPSRCADLAKKVFDGEYIDDNSTSTK